MSDFGEERVEDVATDERRRKTEGCRRSGERRETWARGRATDCDGADLDRPVVGAWHDG